MTYSPLSILLKIGFVLVIVLRIQIYQSDLFEHRPELVTPFSSFQRISEGIFLKNQAISPYQSDLVHAPPLLLASVDYIQQSIESTIGNAIQTPLGSVPIYQLIGIATDMAIALIIKFIVASYLRSEENQRDVDQSHESFPKTFVDNLDSICAFIYFSNPWTVATSAANSSSSIETSAMLLCLLFSMKGHTLLGTFFLAISVYLSLYTVQLIVPVSLLIANHAKQKRASIVLSVICFAGWLIGLVAASNAWMLQFSGRPATSLSILELFQRLTELRSEDFRWMKNSYWALMTVEDLSPNIGLFWYFFQEVFDHFRSLFCWVLQLHSFVYVVPMSIRFHYRPTFLFFLLIVVITTFKTYPVSNDIAVEIVLWEMFWVILVDITWRAIFIRLIFIFITFILPVAWGAWIYKGSGNANFFYGPTLVLSLAQVWLVSESIRSVLERDYVMKIKARESKQE